MRLTGDSLTHAIEATNSALIEVRDASGETFLGRISKAVALQLANSGDYFGIGSPTRIKGLRWIERREFPRDASYWDGRGVIRFCASGVSAGMVSAHRDARERIYGNGADN